MSSRWSPPHFMSLYCWLLLKMVHDKAQEQAGKIKTEEVSCAKLAGCQPTDHHSINVVHWLKTIKCFSSLFVRKTWLFPNRSPTDMKHKCMEGPYEMCPSLPTVDVCSCICIPTVCVRVIGEDRCQSFSLYFILKLGFSQLYSMFMHWCVWPPFLCMCVGVSANRSVRWDAAESSCHSLMSKLAAFTFHLQSQETVWPEWSYHNVLSRCRVGHLTLYTHKHGQRSSADLNNRIYDSVQHCRTLSKNSLEYLCMFS